MHLTIRGRDFSIEKRLPNNEIQIKDIVTNEYFARPESLLVELLFQGDAELLGDNRNQDVLKKRLEQTGVSDLTLLDEADPRRPVFERLDGTTSWRIKREDVLHLVGRIEKNISPLPDDSRRQTIGFDHALRIYSRLGAGLTQFLQLILKKQILPCGVTNSEGTTFSRLRFDKQAILAYVRVERQHRKQNALFLKEAATELGIVEDTAYFLRDKGILKVESNRVGLGQGSIITRAEIEEFKLNYVSAGELARELNTSPNRILELLASRNVYPIMGPSVDGCYQYLFRRSDVGGIGVDLKQLSIEERIGSIARDPRTRLTVEQIADKLQMSVERVSHLIESGLLLPLKPRLRPCDSNVFNGYAVERYLRLMGGRVDLVSGPIAAKMLGVSNGSLPYFVRTRKLIPVTLEEKDRFKYFKREDVERLIRLRQAKNG